MYSAMDENIYGCDTIHYSLFIRIDNESSLRVCRKTYADMKLLWKFLELFETIAIYRYIIFEVLIS